MEVLRMTAEELMITLIAYQAGERRVAKVSDSGIVFPAIVVN
jgi:hypothetical protein